MFWKITGVIGILSIISIALLFMLRVKVTEKITKSVIVDYTLDKLLLEIIKPGGTGLFSGLVNSLISIDVGLRFGK